jgi:hypothetical protein
MRRIPFLTQLLKSEEFSTKIYIYFSSKVAGDYYDNYEKNYTFTSQNPKVIKGYVREVSPESAYYKQYGLHKSGVLEVLCDDKYREWFRNCNRIVINDIDYQVFKDGTGAKIGLMGRPYKTLRVTLTRKE